MLSKIISASTIGLDGVLIKVEVDVYERGFPTFTIVGLPNKAIEESKERVRTAIKNSGFKMPESRIVVNLAPADVPKEGSLFDLPIALGILASSGYIDKSLLNRSLFIGELSLDGFVQPVGGILPVTLLAKEKNLTQVFVPKKNIQEASVIKKMSAFPVDSLAQLILHLNGHAKIKKAKQVNLQNIVCADSDENNFSDIKGQITAKQAIVIAASGGHNIHLKGTPGAGKTMLAKALPSILPAMDEDEIIEVSKIYSVTNAYKNTTFMVNRPFRAPHHTISRVGIIGGGSHIVPGEVSLAHRGVLFLDEFPEFPRSVLEALRQPLEDGYVTVSRAAGSITFPTRFIFIAASNPCPCGYLGHPKKSCKCSMHQILKYKKRVSGPILDRIDIHIDVPPVSQKELTDEVKTTSSKDLKRRITQARKRQAIRFKNEKIKVNAEMTTPQIKKYCVLTQSAQNLLKIAFSRLNLSARSYYKIIKIAQTIADIKNEDVINEKAISQALQYRVKDE